MLSRRRLLKSSAYGGLALSSNALGSLLSSGGKGAVRCLNIVNFIRGVEPRGPVDLLLPVQRQMDEIVRRGLPATWLLQYDALVSGPFVEHLKRRMPASHEVGFWFEMNQMLVEEAKVAWRGRPGYEWDHYPSVAFSIGYTPEERIKLVDTAMAGFKRVWGFYPRSVASWNLDAISMAHMSEGYGVDAFAVCRDQIATDGFTIWGAPIAGYYPSKRNCWSAAVDRSQQINTPVFRMLGQDPVYYYNKRSPLPDGRMVGEPDTMEPVWTSGRSRSFVRAFLKMIASTGCGRFAYAQIGQENSFGWPDMAQALPEQLDALVALQRETAAHVETMGDSGRRFKAAFTQTPVQTQVMLEDPYANTTPANQTVWFQSRFYRANLHVAGDLVYLRDLTVYSDRLAQPFLDTPTRDFDVEQRLPAILDGYHWAQSPGALGAPTAAGRFLVDGEPVRLTGALTVFDRPDLTRVEVPTDRGVLTLSFEVSRIVAHHDGPGTLGVSFEWDAKRAPLPEVRGHRVVYSHHGLSYGVHLPSCTVTSTAGGWSAQAGGRELAFELSQQRWN